MNAADDVDLAAIRRAISPIRRKLADTLVALDFDGVLAPIVERSEDARALPGAAEALADLAGRVAAIAVVTGRPAADAAEFAGLSAVPGVVVLGHYGLERWQAGRLTTPARHDGVDHARRRVTDIATGRPGVTVEDKGHSVALHTRRAADPSRALAGLVPLVDVVARESGLQVTPGRYVLELRPPGVDKGSAIRGLVAEFGVQAVVYAGDDLGDLPAVEAVRSLSADVTGLVVCSDAEESPAELREGADLVVPGPPGVLAVLRELAAVRSESS